MGVAHRLFTRVHIQLVRITLIAEKEMREGWSENDYFAYCETKEESVKLSRGYGLAERMPGYTLVGLKGWDDFILKDDRGQRFTVPTVPVVSQYLSLLESAPEPDSLRSDPRFEGKIKWYRTPVVFGGSPTDKANMMWITYEAHQEAVRAWNQIYDDLQDKAANKKEGDSKGCVTRPPSHDPG